MEMDLGDGTQSTMIANRSQDQMTNSNSMMMPDMQGGGGGGMHEDIEMQHIASEMQQAKQQGEALSLKEEIENAVMKQMGGSDLIDEKAMAKDSSGFAGRYSDDIIETLIVAGVFFVLTMRVVSRYVSSYVPFMSTETNEPTVFNMVIRALMAGIFVYVIKRTRAYVKL